MEHIPQKQYWKLRENWFEEQVKSVLENTRYSRDDFEITEDGKLHIFGLFILFSPEYLISFENWLNSNLN